MKLFKCGISFVVAVLIIYCAYVGEIQCVAVLSSTLALHACHGFLRGEQDE